MNTSHEPDTSYLGVLSETDDGRWSLKVRVGTRLQRCRGYWPKEHDAQAALDLYASQVRMGLVPVLPVGDGARADNNAGSVGMLKADPQKWSVRMRVAGKVVRCRGYWPSKKAAEQALSDWAVLQRNGYAPAALVGPLGVRGTSAGSAESPADPAHALAAMQMLGALGAKEFTPLREVYLASIRTKGGLDTSTDRQSFYRTVMTGEARARRGDEAARRVLGDVPVSTLTRQDIEEWAVALQTAGGLSVSTVAKYGRHLKQCLKWAVNNDYITRNPMDGITELVPRGSVRRSRPPRYFMTLAEMWKIASATRPGMEEVLCQTILWSGLRQAEVRGLTPESLIRGEAVPLLLVAAQVKTRKKKPGQTRGETYLKHPKTDAGIRKAAIPVPLMRMLVRLAESTQPGQPLFPAPKGTARSPWMRGEYLNRRWAAWCETAGIAGNPVEAAYGRGKPPRPHDARATVASILGACNVPTRQAQKFLGHESPLLTMGLYDQGERFGREEPIFRWVAKKSLSLGETINEVYMHSELAQTMPRPDKSGQWDLNRWGHGSDDRSATLTSYLGMLREEELPPPPNALPDPMSDGATGQAQERAVS